MQRGSLLQLVSEKTTELVDLRRALVRDHAPSTFWEINTEGGRLPNPWPLLRLVLQNGFIAMTSGLTEALD